MTIPDENIVDAILQAAIRKPEIFTEAEKKFITHYYIFEESMKLIRRKKGCSMNYIYRLKRQILDKVWKSY